MFFEIAQQPNHDDDIIIDLASRIEYSSFIVKDYEKSSYFS